MWKKLPAIIGLTLALFESGCATVPEARYVYQDGEFGVIGIPLNSPLGKENFLGQAHMLMREHFPEGYEIVRAEEVIEGDRLLQTDKKAEVNSEPTIAAASQLIKLGKITGSKSVEQRDMVKILESRIIYKRKPANGPSGVNGFAAVSSATPQFYLDPNQVMRDHNQIMLADCKSSHSADKHDSTTAAARDTAALKTSLVAPSCKCGSDSSKH